MTPGLLMNTMLITTTRGQLMLENMDTTVVLSVKTRRSRSATSIPMRTLARSPRQLAKRLLPPFTLRSVRKLSTLFVRKRKIPKTTCKKIVATIYIEECEEIIHTVCEEAQDPQDNLQKDCCHHLH